MGIVWHGNYIKYFEDGRESWGQKYGLHYLEVYKNGITTPIVHTSIDHKLSLYYGEKAIIRTEYIDSMAAKLIYKYTILRESDKKIVATGKTIQVFMNMENELLLNFPQFVIDWKKKQGLL
ncbi:MAG: acyl-CoA thioesterase [Bacteroidales bacterium]|nr:acyl-CoA thioesterase [Bacteroidales bacterium]